MCDNIYNIAIATNGAYVNYSIVLLESIFKTNPSRKFCVYVLWNSLTEQERNKLENYVNKKGSEIVFIYITGEKYKVFEWKERFSVETYFRLDLQDILPQDVERIFYLDIDMIICNDLAELYESDFEDKYIIACGFSPKCEKGDEFNAGMILFNISKMRKENITFTTYAELAKELNGNFYQDQGLLNALFGEHGTKYVEKYKYNFTCPFYRKFKQEISLLDSKFTLDDIVVLHYAGPGIRPWLWKIGQAEYERLKKKDLLKFFALKGYIIDDLYMQLQTKWWDTAECTDVYQEIEMTMFEKKSRIYEEVLDIVADSNDYKVGMKMMNAVRTIKKVVKRKEK